ncbi:hypothetical protein Lesp01_59330 [Lentzea sp. NBRC 102530]|nr:hypothetical protein Lesp01_59330 [Lentzea sp. NBRC 102530]
MRVTSPGFGLYVRTDLPRRHLRLGSLRRLPQTDLGLAKRWFRDRRGTHGRQLPHNNVRRYRMGGAGTKTGPPKPPAEDIREPRTTWFRGSRRGLAVEAAQAYQRPAFCFSAAS